MSGPRRAALIVASYEYTDASLSRLRAPARDAESLASILAEDSIGGFDVRTCVDQSSHVVRREIARFYADRGRDDLLLLYFSGHGIKDQSGRLYFAMRDTERDLPDATAIPASFVNDRMEECRARTNLLILDCCFAGAFARGLASKADTSVHVGEPFAAEEPGAGRVVLTASDAMQYAFEGDDVQGESTKSIFTGCLVEGLRSGAADLDRDGEISITEIYDYLYDRVRSAQPHQRPLKWEWGVRGRVVLARNPSAEMVALPPELSAAASSPLPSMRTAAIADLTTLLRHPDRRMAAAARKALTSLTEDDSRSVARAATEALGPELATAPECRVPRPPKPAKAPTDETPARTVPEPEAQRPPVTPPVVPEGGPGQVRRRLPMLVGGGILAILVLVGVIALAGGGSEGPETTSTSLITTATTQAGPIVTTGGTSATTPTTPPTTASSIRNVFDLSVGDCFSPPSDAVWSTVQIVPCSQSHVFEVISNNRKFQEAAGAPWPGDASLGQRTNQGCIEDFAGYVGIAYSESRLYTHAVTPSRAYWDSGGRAAICMVREVDSSARTGSARNLRQ